VAVHTPMNLAGMRRSLCGSPAAAPAGSAAVLLQLLRRAARARCSSTSASSCAPAEWPSALTCAKVKTQGSASAAMHMPEVKSKGVHAEGLEYGRDYRAWE
jgi:hypothetical protein